MLISHLLLKVTVVVAQRRRRVRIPMTTRAVESPNAGRNTLSSHLRATPTTGVRRRLHLQLLQLRRQSTRVVEASDASVLVQLRREAVTRRLTLQMHVRQSRIARIAYPAPLIPSSHVHRSYLPP